MPFWPVHAAVHTLVPVRASMPAPDLQVLARAALSSEVDDDVLLDHVARVSEAWSGLDPQVQDAAVRAMAEAMRVRRDRMALSRQLLEAMHSPVRIAVRSEFHDALPRQSLPPALVLFDAAAPLEE